VGSSPTSGTTQNSCRAQICNWCGTTLIRALLMRVRECGSVAGVLLCIDGLASYAKQALFVFREARRTGRVGRASRLVLPDGVMVAKVVKRYARHRVVEVIRSVVRCAEAAVVGRIVATQGRAEAVITPPTSSFSTRPFERGWRLTKGASRAGVHKRATPEAGM
jgi:hypothetical protein